MKIESLWEEFQKLESKAENKDYEEYGSVLCQDEAKRYKQETDLDKELVAVMHNTILLMEATSREEDSDYYSTHGRNVFKEIERKVQRVTQIRLLKKEYGKFDGTNSYQRLRLFRISERETHEMLAKLSRFQRQLAKSFE